MIPVKEVHAAVNYAEPSAPELLSICARRVDVASWREFMQRFNPVIARSTPGAVRC